MGRTIVKNPFTGKVYGEKSGQYSRKMSSSEQYQSLQEFKSSGAASSYQQQQADVIQARLDAETKARELVEEQIRKEGALTQAQIEAQNKADEEKIQQMNTQQLARYLSARTAEDQAAELQTRAALQNYYEKVLKGEDEKKARYKLQSTLGYEFGKIEKQFQRDIQVPEKPMTTEQEAETLKAIEKYGLPRFISATTETLKEQQLKEKAIREQFRINVEKGMSEEKARYKMESQLAYERSKAGEDFTKRLNEGKLKIINTESRTDEKIIRMDLFNPKLIKPIKEVNKEGVISAPRYIFLPNKGKAEGLSPQGAYLEFIKGREKEIQLFNYSDIVNPEITKKQEIDLRKTTAIAYRTGQDFYSKTIGGLGSNVAADVITYYALGSGTSAVARFMLGSATPLASKTFKGLSAVAGIGFIGGTGAKYYIYEKSLAGTPGYFRATAPNAPNIIEDIIKVASFTVGLKAGMEGFKVEQESKPLRRTESKLEWESKSLKKETIVQRSRSVKKLEIKLKEAGFTQSEIKQVLLSKRVTSGEPVTVTYYKPVEGVKSIGGIKKGFFVTIEGKTTGFYITEKGFRANVTITPKTTTINYRDIKTGKLIDTRKFLTLENALEQKGEPQFGEYTKILVNKPGFKAIEKGAFRFEIFGKTGVKQGVTTTEELFFLRSLTAKQLTSVGPTVTTQRTGVITFEGPKFTGTQKIITEPPKIEYATTSKLIPETYTFEYSKTGDFLYTATKPGKVYGRIDLTGIATGKGTITQVQPGSQPVNVFFEMLGDKRGILLAGAETIQIPQTITVPSPSVQLYPQSQFTTISPGVFTTLPRIQPRYDTLILPVSITKVQPQVKEKLNFVPQQLPQEKVSLIEQQIPVVEQIPVQEIIPKQQVRTTQQIQQIQITTPFVPIAPSQNIPRIVDIPKVTETPFPGIPELPKFKEPKEKFGRFTVLVRRKGKFQPIAVVSTPEKAFAIGRRKVQQTAAASFKILPTPQRKSIPKQIFYESKREPGVFIQKRKFRISSFGEKREIPGKSLFVRRTRSKLKNIFGGL